MFCKLCKKEVDLQLSHIYPKFFIKQVRDKSRGNKFEVISSVNKYKPQDGPKEKLLCKECEQIFSLYEKYYKETFIDENLDFMKYDNDFSIIQNSDFKKTKYFLLSILWRLSVSSIDGFKLELSIDDQKELEAILLNKKDICAEEFPIIATKIQYSNKKVRIFREPIDIVDKNSIFLLFFDYLFLVSKKRDNAFFSDQPILNPHKWYVLMKSYMELKNFFI